MPAPKPEALTPTKEALDPGTPDDLWHVYDDDRRHRPFTRVEWDKWISDTHKFDNNVGRLSATVQHLLDAFAASRRVEGKPEALSEEVDGLLRAVEYDLIDRAYAHGVENLKKLRAAILRFAASRSGGEAGEVEARCMAAAANMAARLNAVWVRDRMGMTAKQERATIELVAQFAATDADPKRLIDALFPAPCSCDDPTAGGVEHRQDGPCHRPLAAPPAPPPASREGEEIARRAAWDAYQCGLDRGRSSLPDTLEAKDAAVRDCLRAALRRGT